MLRFFGGVLSALLVVAAAIFIWTRAESEELIPPAPQPAALVTPLKPVAGGEPPSASPKSREEKRFARADKDEDGKITLAELVEPRRKPFAKLDVNQDGKLSFEEWAIRTIDKYEGANDDKNGWLTPAEYASTAPKRKAKPKCGC